MTLIIAGASKFSSFVAADRRLTANGSVEEDDRNKSFFVVCDDARFGFSYWGLAKAKDWSTERELFDQLPDIAKAASYNMQGILDGLGKTLSDLQARLNKRYPLGIVGAGFRYREDSPEGFVFEIAVDENGTEKKCVDYARYDAVELRFAGGGAAYARSGEGQFRDVLGREVPMKGLASVCAKNIKRVAKSDNTVGSNLHSLIIKPSKESVLRSFYFAENRTNRLESPSCVYLETAAKCSVLGRSAEMEGLR